MSIVESPCVKFVVKIPPVPNVPSSWPAWAKARVDEAMTTAAARNPSRRPLLWLSWARSPSVSELRFLPANGFMDVLLTCRLKSAPVRAIDDAYRTVSSQNLVGDSGKENSRHRRGCQQLVIVLSNVRLLRQWNHAGESQLAKRTQAGQC